MLRAAQVAVGMLGVMTSLELAVAPAYRLRERVEHRSWADVSSAGTSSSPITGTSGSSGCPTEGSGRALRPRTPAGQA